MLKQERNQWKNQTNVSNDTVPRDRVRSSDEEGESIIGTCPGPAEKKPQRPERTLRVNISVKVNRVRRKWEHADQDDRCRRRTKRRAGGKQTMKGAERTGRSNSSVRCSRS